MTNFKGTKGKRQDHKNAFCCVISDTGILVANCGGRTSNINPDDLISEQKANALLVSKAPEMLDMLERMKYHLEPEDKDDFEMYNEIVQIIKEATEL